MEQGNVIQTIEIQLTGRYRNAHSWTVQAITGFLSAYFMEHPGFRVQRHHDDAASGGHVWVCEVPAEMKIPRLVKRLQADLPAFRATPIDEPRGSYRLDLHE